MCNWIKATLVAAGSDFGAMAGGGAGLFTGPAAVVASPVAAASGMMAGASIGAALGEIVDNVFFSKSSGGNGGSRFRGGKQSQRDADYDRLYKEFKPSRQQRTRIHEEIGKQKMPGQDKLPYDDLRQIFIDIVGRQ